MSDKGWGKWQEEPEPAGKHADYLRPGRLPGSQFAEGAEPTGKATEVFKGPKLPVALPPRRGAN